MVAQLEQRKSLSIVGLAAFGLAIIVSFTVAYLAFAAPRRASAALFYCTNVTTPYGYECGPANVYAYDYNINEAYYPNLNGQYICERATVRYNGSNLSFRCGGSPVNSGCDERYSNTSASPLSNYVQNRNGYGIALQTDGKLTLGGPCA